MQVPPAAFRFQGNRLQKERLTVERALPEGRLGPECPDFLAPTCVA